MAARRCSGIRTITISSDRLRVMRVQMDTQAPTKYDLTRSGGEACPGNTARPDRNVTTCNAKH